MPKVDIIKAFKKIYQNASDNFKPVLDYFETYYIGELMTNSKTQRKQPFFPIDMWNVNEVIERTNNSLESWHKQFQVGF